MLFSAYPEEQRDLRWVTITLTVIATLLLVWRIINTTTNRGWLGVEDVLVIIANMWLILLAAFIYKSTTYGFGMRVVDVENTGGDVRKALKFFWLTQSLYTLTNGFYKMSFLALYYRIFPTEPFQKACKILGAISVGWTVSYVFVCIFQCTPVPRAYDRSIPGTCINFAWQRWTNAILNLLTDIAIFILPMPVIVRLNMALSTRIGLVVLFSMGFFICLITALRMATLPLSLKTSDPTWEAAPTNLWSFIEAATGVICACLVSLRKGVATLWPSKWRWGKAKSGAYRQYDDNEPNCNELHVLRARKGTDARRSYAMGTSKGDDNGNSATYVDVSPNESQEHIIKASKTMTQVTTSRPRSSGSRSEDLVLQVITVTRDVEVIRD